jgi:hypothetical protein
VNWDGTHRQARISAPPEPENEFPRLTMTEAVCISATYPRSKVMGIKRRDLSRSGERELKYELVTKFAKELRGSTVSGTLVMRVDCSGLPYPKICQVGIVERGQDQAERHFLRTKIIVHWRISSARQSFEAFRYILTIGLALYTILHWWSMIEENQKELGIIPQNGIFCMRQCEAGCWVSPRLAGAVTVINGR